MKKRFIFLPFLLLNQWLSANMASPYRGGAKHGSPYSSRHIAIVHEQLNIDLLNFNQAAFDVTYTIEVDSVGSRFPLVFDAGNQGIEGFTVLIDGLEVETQKLPSEYSIDKSKKEEIIEIFRPEYLDINSLWELRYFEVEKLTKGTHTINVKYIAETTTHLRRGAKNCLLEYNLRPAKNWKEAKSIDIAIKSHIDGAKVNVSLPDDVKTGDLQWHLSSVEYDELTVTVSPALTKYQQNVLEYGEEVFVYVGLLLFILIHTLILIRTRKVADKYHVLVVALAGAFIFPFWGTFLYLGSHSFIDHVLGEHASAYWGYSALAIFTFAFCIPLYLIYLFIVDFIAKKILKRKQIEQNK